jgi:hypothetical protein
MMINTNTLAALTQNETSLEDLLIQPRVDISKLLSIVRTGTSSPIDGVKPPAPHMHRPPPPLFERHRYEMSQAQPRHHQYIV